MENTPSTLLDLTLAHWLDVKDTANNNSVSVKRNKWVTLSSIKWPSFNVGWQTGGTFDSETMDRVARIIYHPGAGHPDQIPYLATWRGQVSPQKWLIDKERRSYPWVKVSVSTGL